MNVRFAHLIGVELHENICEKRALFGEWLFSSLLFQENPKRAEYPQIFKPVFEQAAPVFDSLGELSSVICLLAPHHVMNGTATRKVRAQVEQAARAVSRELGYPGALTA